MELKSDDVEWIVNDIAELGVKIGNQFFFLYKGASLDYSQNGGYEHDDGTLMKWRRVGKREFGECCHPWEAIKKQSGEYRLPESYIGFYPEESDPANDNIWKDFLK